MNIQNILYKASMNLVSGMLWISLFKNKEKSHLADLRWVDQRAAATLRVTTPGHLLGKGVSTPNYSNVKLGR